MGWRDRDYARGGAFSGAHSAPRRGVGGGRSIVTTLIVINVVLFALGEFFPALGVLLSGGSTRGPFGLAHRYGVAELVAGLVMQGQVWRLVTAQYLHAGLGHIFFNMLVLHFLGRPLEAMWSARKFFTIYTVCGVSGNVFYTVLAYRGVIDPGMPAVGASGSIYGLLGVVAVLFPTATVYLYFLFPIRIRTAALIFGGISLFQIIQRGNNYGGEACHLAGLGFGVWWAMKGEAWWARTEWRLPGLSGRRRPSRTRGTSSRQGGFARRVEERRVDAETIDRILRKVYDGGIQSLSESEKRELQAATDRQRQRERDAGRVDRV